MEDCFLGKMASPWYRPSGEDCRYHGHDHTRGGGCVSTRTSTNILFRFWKVWWQQTTHDEGGRRLDIGGIASSSTTKIRSVTRCRLTARWWHGWLHEIGGREGGWACVPDLIWSKYCWEKEGADRGGRAKHLFPKPWPPVLFSYASFVLLGSQPAVSLKRRYSSWTHARLLSVTSHARRIRKLGNALKALFSARKSRRMRYFWSDFGFF